MIYGLGINTMHPASIAYVNANCDEVRIHDCGASWGAIETAPGVYDFTRFNSLAAAFPKKRLLYVLSHTPEFHAEKGVTGTPGIMSPHGNCPPDIKALAAFVGAFCRNAQSIGRLGDIDFEPWNELNAVQFWDGSASQAQTVAVLVYSIAKAFNPACTVLTPSFCRNETTAAQALDAWLGGWMARWADAIAFHGYLPPGAPAGGVATVIADIEAVMAKHGVDQPPWDTEWGCGNDRDAAAQAVFVTEGVAARIAAGVAAIIPYQTDNPTHMMFMDPNTGVVTPAGQAWSTIYNSSVR